MSKFIVSKLEASVAYTEAIGDGVRRVLVHGGVGVAIRGAGLYSPSGVGAGLRAPHGVRTEVSDDDAEFLATHKLFLEHQQRGFVRIEDIARDP